MRTSIVTALVLFAIASVARSEPPSDELVKRLTAVIREHCPDAKFKVEGNTFTAKHGTMMFTVHGRFMSGEIRPKAHQEEGPNFKGFLLTVTLEQGHRVNQAATPQTLRQPYWKTYINDPLTEDGENQYWIRFSYGSRLDEKLKKAILDALPNGRSKRERAAQNPNE